MTDYTTHLTGATFHADTALEIYRAKGADDDARDALLVALTELVYVTSLIGDDASEGPADRAWLVSYAVSIARGVPLMNAADLVDTAAEVYYN